MMRGMLRSLLSLPVLVMLALPVWADARITVLLDVIKLREAAQILRDEGLVYAQELNEDMLGGQGGSGWQVQVDGIYDPDRLLEQMRTALAAHMEGAVLEEAITFFASDLGQRIVTLENTARIAMREPDVEEAARARYTELDGTDDPRLAQIVDFATTGDMIDRNVTSAMNANYQFMRGLADGGALDMSQAEMLAEVNGDVAEITDDTTSWLLGFFLLAYHPLSDADLQTYASFAKTEAGIALNAALFEGFGKAYEDISYALGRATAVNMTAKEL